jgi:acetylglutamate kinase
MTDITGILQDKHNPDTLIPVIDLADAKALVDSGVVCGGMIPKVECCVDAIKRGVKKVFIMDGRVPHSILIETLTDEGAGTMVVADKTRIPAQNKERGLS